MSELDFSSLSHKPKKIHYDQKYSKLWEKEKNFEGWIQASTKGIYYFYCKICKRDLTCGGGKYNIAKHATSTKHLNNLKGGSSPCSDSGATDHKELYELLNDDPLKELPSLKNEEEIEINCKEKRQRTFKNNTDENNYSNKEINFEKWARKKKEMLEIELFEMRNYKMKLELWEKEQELQLSSSKYTRNLIRK